MTPEQVELAMEIRACPRCRITGPGQSVDLVCPVHRAWIEVLVPKCSDPGCTACTPIQR